MKKESVWLEFTPLANHLQTINLGQGFPGWEPEPIVLDALRRAVETPGISQYSSPKGELKLREVIAENYSDLHECEICPETEVMVTVGASEGIYLAIKSLVNTGEEVIVIEPFFDLYLGAIESCGAKARYVAMNIPDCESSTADIHLELDKIKEAINEKTRLLIVNTPHNPTGKVFTRKELEDLGELLTNYPQVKVLSDEVYEHLVYVDKKHISPRSIPTLKDKCVALYSAGKTFSVTGWKIGWAVGSKELIAEMTASQQWVVFSVATPLQHAVADLLVEAKKPYRSHQNFYDYLKRDYYYKKNILLRGLKEAGFTVIDPEGGFFIVTTAPEDNYYESPENYLKLTTKARIQVDQESLGYPSYNLSRHLSMKQGVTSIPMAAFSSDSNKTKIKSVRFAFCKKEEDLITATELLSEK